MKLYRNFATQEELDREYNVTAAVPDSDQVIQSWIERSAMVLDREPARLGVRYGPTLAEYLDIFPTETTAPVHIFFHGGYWRRFSARDFAFLAPTFTAAGITLVVVNYALCPEVSIAEIVRQARAAVAWVAHHAPSFGGDPERITISGHSAGGHLVAMTAFTDWPGSYGLAADTIKGGLAISGLFDLRPFPFTWLQPTLQLDWGQVLRLSPILNIPEHAPPLVVAVGGEETAEFRRQSRDFHTACVAAGLVCGYVEAAGLDHFRILDELTRPDSELFAAVLNLVHGG
jgi:arylformamidase